MRIIGDAEIEPERSPQFGANSASADEVAHAKSTCVCEVGPLEPAREDWQWLRRVDPPSREQATLRQLAYFERQG